MVCIPQTDQSDQIVRMAWLGKHRHSVDPGTRNKASSRKVVDYVHQTRSCLPRR